MEIGPFRNQTLIFWPPRQCLAKIGEGRGWRQDNGNRSNQESNFDFLATHNCHVKIGEGGARTIEIGPIRNQILIF